MCILSTLAAPERPGLLGGGPVRRMVIDEPLPVDFPVGRPRSVRDVVLDRDGSTCRFCGCQQDLPVRLASLAPAAPKGLWI